VVSEVFGYDRSADGLPAYDFAIAGERLGPVRTDTGLSIVVEHGLDRVPQADLVGVLAGMTAGASHRRRFARCCGTPWHEAAGS